MSNQTNELPQGGSVYQPPQLIEDASQHPAPFYTQGRATEIARQQEEWVWPEYNPRVSLLSRYDRRFSGLLGDVGGDIAGLAPTGSRQPDDPKRFMVVDLMATPTALRDLQRRLTQRVNGLGGVAFRGIAVGLNDKSTPKQREDDRANGISFIQGNICDPATWREIEEMVGDKGADVVIEDALGGLPALAPHRDFYQAAFRGMWGITRLGGTMLLNTPNGIDLKRYGLNVRRVEEGLKAQGAEVQRNPDSLYSPSWQYRIRRTF